MSATAAAAADPSRSAGHGAGDHAFARPAHLPAVRRARPRRAHPGLVDARACSSSPWRTSREEAREAAGLGIRAILLFGIPAAKDARGSESYAQDGIIPRAIAAVKDACPGPRRGHRRVHVRVHRSRPLRHPEHRRRRARCRRCRKATS